MLYRNTLKFLQMGVYQSKPEDTEEKVSSTDHLTDQPEKYEGYTYRCDQYDVQEYVNDRKKL